MTILRWKTTGCDPFRELSTLQEGMNRLLEEMLPTTGKKQTELNEGTFNPAVDIYEDDMVITLKAELPGMKKEDVQVEINDGVITLKGERKMETDEKKNNYCRIERGYGSFHRSFTLPDTVDRDKIKAHYKEGILELTFPRAEEPKLKSIPVEVN